MRRPDEVGIARWFVCVCQTWLTRDEGSRQRVCSGRRSRLEAHLHGRPVGPPDPTESQIYDTVVFLSTGIGGKLFYSVSLLPRWIG